MLSELVALLMVSTDIDLNVESSEVRRSSSRLSITDETSGGTLSPRQGGTLSPRHMTRQLIRTHNGPIELQSWCGPLSERSLGF